MNIETRLASLESSVRRWHLICCALCVLVLASIAIAAAPSPAASGPRYQLTAIGSNLLVLDNTNNQVSLLFKKRLEGAIQPNWPWAVDNTFSLEDALAKPEGAAITAGAGR